MTTNLALTQQERRLIQDAYRIDGNLLRLDSDQTARLKRELEAIDAEAYRIEYGQLKARNLVPLQPNIPDWARQYTWRMFDHTGKPRVIGNKAKDLPTVNVKAEEESKNIYTLGQAAEWDREEVRAALYNGQPIDGELAIAARDTIEREIDDILAVGHSGPDMDGILTLSTSDVTTYTPADKDGGSSSPNWFNGSGNLIATAEEMADDVLGLVDAVVDATDELYTGFVVVLPLAHYRALQRTPKGDNADRTVLRYIQENGDNISRIVPWSKCKNVAGSSDENRMACWPDGNRRVVAGIVPMEFTPLEVQMQGLAYIRPYIAKTAGVVARYPVAIGYADDI